MTNKEMKKSYQSDLFYKLLFIVALRFLSIFVLFCCEKLVMAYCNFYLIFNWCQFSSSFNYA